ncbi:aminotransferase class III-fold pyridoxal phosphate-dependent enzyme [Streptomyces sp. NPDC013433]|uniref:aminotransferase class III-fold pyridoxal phosphate-dependent enzyme n=1 Tax=Streptomyces sp. NPDC013433 TaxID=3155604 RepID=UPI003453EAA0
MTDVTSGTEAGKAAASETSAVDDGLVAELVARARAGGVKLTGEGGLLQRLTKRVLESALEGGLTDHLGHGPGERAGGGRDNYRNGHRSKRVITESGPVGIAVPRDRAGSFEPQLVKKRQRRLGGVDEMVLSLSAKGLTHGALAVTANPAKRAGAGVPLPHTVPVPFDDPTDDEGTSVARLVRSLDGAAAGGPLAVVETVQGEGGINPARPVWLRALAAWAREQGAFVVVDDIQMGCGRTGPFFSFETAGIVPALVCLSKSISGYGTPMALTLMRPEYDVWKPGERNGTFRRHSPAFVTGPARWSCSGPTVLWRTGPPTWANGCAAPSPRSPVSTG